MTIAGSSGEATSSCEVRREPGRRIPGLTTFGEEERGELYAGTQGGRVYRLVR